MHRRYILPACVAVLLALFAANVGPIVAASLNLSFLPVVIGAPVATTCDGSAPLLDQDTGLLSAGLDAGGRYILAYQDRAHGSRAHVVQHVGDHLVELAAPPEPVVLRSVQPAFSPDGAKQGALALVMGASGAKSRLYYTQRRADDDPTVGPYGIWCMEF